MQLPLQLTLQGMDSSSAIEAAVSHLVNARFEQLRIGSPVQFIAQAGGQGPQARRVSLGKHGFG